MQAGRPESRQGDHMKIAVIGTGYVGLVTGSCLANFGNEVLCVDVDKEKVESLNAGKVPFFEPGLGDLLSPNLSAGRLAFTTDLDSAVRGRIPDKRAARWLLERLVGRLKPPSAEPL
mgnify:CR=1 FL=1